MWSLPEFGEAQLYIFNRRDFALSIVPAGRADAEPSSSERRRQAKKSGGAYIPARFENPSCTAPNYVSFKNFKIEESQH